MKEQKFWEKVVWFQFLFSIFVIWCHSENSAMFLANGNVSGPLSAETEVVRYLGRLGVAGFYLCSGYLFYRNFKLEKLLEKWKSRVYTLLLPYFIWNFIYFILHWAVLQVPGLRGMFSEQQITWSVQTLLDALLRYRYNPIFWYLQYLIIFVLLCPILYGVLKNKYIGLAFLALLLVLQSGVVCQVSSTFWNPGLNWLFIYGAGAYAGIHLREQMETRTPSLKVVAMSGMAAVACGIGYTLYVNVVFSLLYFLTAPCFLVLLIRKIELPKPAEWMHYTFFVYASHHILVRVVTKLAARRLPGNTVVAWILFLAAPVYAYAAAWIFRKICSGKLKIIWKVLTGDRA